MNNLTYSKQKSEDVAPRVEEIIRKDLNSSSPLIYSLAESGIQAGALESIAKTAANFIFGGNETVLFRMKFDIATPKPITLEVNVNRQGIGSHVGSITFSAFINKMITAEVALEAPKFFGSSKFTGDATVASKLNGNKNLLKAADKFARVQSDIGGGLKMDRYFRLIPAANGTHIVVITLPRATSMGMSATTDANDFFGIVEMIDAAL
ncbi:MAG: hypothetical protein HY064_02845 [Bacteroidetes bacterium]|nr:hypothetical protein [Bacteroidota bacterium]